MNFLKIIIITIFSVILTPCLAIAEMKLTSGSIINSKIDKLHACSKKGGKDVSPQLTLSGIPNGTKRVGER